MFHLILNFLAYRMQQYGLSGPVWFLVGNATPLCLMGIIVTRFRTRVPGAETFPQLMLALFGKRVHLLFCSLIILNNISTIASVITSKFLQVLNKYAEIIKLYKSMMHSSFTIVARIFGSISKSFLIGNYLIA